MVERTKYILSLGSELRIKIKNKCNDLSNQSNSMVEVLKNKD